MGDVVANRARISRRAFAWSCLGLAGWLVAGSALGAESVRVMTWNVRNYLSQDRSVEGVWRRDYPKPEGEKSALREVLRRLQPDVLALQEMGEQKYVLELREDLRKEGFEWPYLQVLNAADEPRHLAVLSRLPFRATFHFENLAFNYLDAPAPVPVKRGLLECRFETAGQEWRLFVVHLKSRYTDRADDPESRLRRTAEARVIRDYLRKTYPPDSGALYVVAGDFNDHPNSSPLRHFLEIGGRPLLRMLPAADSRGEVWTHFWATEESYSRVDYLLVSPGLLPRVADGRARVGDDPLVLQASDHRPVWADLRF